MPEFEGLFFSDTGGAGQAVVLLHGLLMDSQMWDAQVEALRDTYRVITIDAPGHGSSQPAPKGFDFAMYAKQVWSLLDAIGVKDAVFGGQSMGGWTSLRCNALRPSSVKGLILADTSVQVESPDMRPQYEAFLQVALSDGVGVDLANILLLILFSERFASSDASGAWRKKFTEDDPARLEHAARAVFERPDVSSLLEDVRCPSIVIHGESDIAIPMERAEEIAQALNAPLHRIPDAGHASPTERPELVTPIIRTFLDSL